MGVSTARTKTTSSPAATTPKGGEARGTSPASRGASLLRSRLRTPRRPRIWFEITLIAVSYWVYSMIRNAVPEQRQSALRNADWIWDAEQALGIAVEHSINHAINGVTWLILSLNYYYATLHFVVTIGVLVWLYRWHPGRYGAARAVIFAATGAALLGYYLFPLAPPRLMQGVDFIDTVQVHQTLGSTASGNLADMSNQYAAMPSMHVGWSVWCGIVIVTMATPLWARLLGVLYPLTTLFVIVATANHFWLDAIGGLLCLGFAFGVVRLWYGRLPHRMPRRVDGSTGGTSPPAQAAEAAKPAVPIGHSRRTGRAATPASESAHTVGDDAVTVDEVASAPTRSEAAGDHALPDAGPESKGTASTPQEP